MAADALKVAAMREAAKEPPPTPSAAPIEASKPVARIYAKARFVWVQRAPRGEPGWIGYMSYGGSLPLRGGTIESARVIGERGCLVWYAVEPRGYVCAGDGATVDPEDPVVKALARDAPHVDSPWPYEYAESLGVPRYPGVPTLADQRDAEGDLDAHLARVAEAKGGGNVARELVGVDLSPAGAEGDELLPMSPLVRDARKFVVMGSTVAYTRAFEVAGRSFVVASDQAVLPRDRMKPYPRSTFKGVELRGEEKLPIVFVRHADAPKYRREGAGFVATGALWPRLDHVGATGEKAIAGAYVYWETKDEGLWAREGDATVAETRASPFGHDTAAGRATWIDVSVLGGTLVAYEGETPVFATLVSPGRGGVPFEDRDPLSTASTPTGRFRVDGKFVTSTMVSSTNDDLVHTEVQYVQNFHGPHALHGAYWHDGWGERKSGGCVNLSPIDAKWLFDFTEPSLPAGWYGLRAVTELGPSTRVWIHR